MERPPKKYVCEKCGYLGDTSEHEGCDYLAWTTGEQLYIDRLELAALRASPASVPEVTDGMAIAFHNALTDGSIGQSEVDEIKTGLRAAIAAAPTPPVSEDKDKIIAAANALENIASTSSSTRIRRVANEALTAIRARRKACCEKS